MQLTVTGRHLVVSDAVRQQIERKLERIHRLLNDSAVSAQCVIARERNQAVCDLTLHARGDHTLGIAGREGLEVESSIGLDGHDERLRVPPFLRRSVGSVMSENDRRAQLAPGAVIAVQGAARCAVARGSSRTPKPS